MLYEVMKHIRNFFPDVEKIENKCFKIEDGVIVLDSVKTGQYFLIEGSIFNDGVHCYTSALRLKDEEFTGNVVPLKIPQDFLSLVSEIEEWNEKNGAVGAYTSESFAGYTYQRATNSAGNAISWKDAFRSRLNTWRKI